MKIRIICLLACLITAQASFAQDILMLKNGEELEIKTLEVGESTIKYKKFTNLEGPTYTVEKSKVFKIKYENGGEDLFNVVEENTSRTTSNARNNDGTFPDQSINVNPLGLLQFGPIVQYEHRIGERSYIVPYFRYAFAGVLTHVIWLSGSAVDEGSLSPASAAIGLGFKTFSNPGNTWYYGGFLDFAWISAEYNPDTPRATEESATELGFYGNVGYRWKGRRNPRSAVNVGLIMGVGTSLSSEETRVDNGEFVADNSSTLLVAMLELSFSFDFRKK
ncbi:MAG: hypothetical protein ACFB0B_13025 [Thermonemataceae bacterium]